MKILHRVILPLKLCSRWNLQAAPGKEAMAKRLGTPSGHFNNLPLHPAVQVAAAALWHRHVVGPAGPVLSYAPQANLAHQFMLAQANKQTMRATEG